MKMRIGILLIAALIYCARAAALPAGYSVYQVNIAEGHLNLRTEPSVKAPVLNHLSKDRCVLATRETRTNENYTWVYLAHPAGWTASQFLQKSDTCEELANLMDTIYGYMKNACIYEFAQGTNYDDAEAYEKNKPDVSTRELRELILSLLAPNFEILGEEICVEMMGNDPFCDGFRTKDPEQVADIILDKVNVWLGCSSPNCVQGVVECYGQCSEDDYPACRSPYESYWNNITIGIEEGKYFIYFGGYDCCNGITLNFDKIDGELKITGVFPSYD